MHLAVETRSMILRAVGRMLGVQVRILDGKHIPHKPIAASMPEALVARDIEVNAEHNGSD